MIFRDYVKNLCKRSHYRGVWLLIDLQQNLFYIIGNLSRYLKPVQIRLNTQNKNILVCYIHPMMIFEIKVQESNIKKRINWYLGENIIFKIIFIPSGLIDLN